MNLNEMDRYIPITNNHQQIPTQLYELEKAARNWTRKMEIAEGQKKVVIQQLRSLKKSQSESAAPSIALESM